MQMGKVFMIWLIGGKMALIRGINYVEIDLE